MLKTLLAINAAKAAARIIKALNLGKASALPGRVALAFDSKILVRFAEDLRDADLGFFVTGTNGKTTSTGILKQICIKHLANKKQNLFVICNDMGANLYYGICSELVQSTDFLARLRSTSYALELDEAAFPKIAEILKPRVIAVTNIYRDQLDRFGEVDSTQKLIVDGINKAIENNNHIQALVLNADDNKVLQIQESFPNIKNILRFKVKYAKNSLGINEGTIKNFEQETNADVDVDLLCEIQEEAPDYSIIKLIYKNSDTVIARFELPGLYNVYNAAAAAAAALAEGIDLNTIKDGIEAYRTVFGRSETKELNGTKYQVFLIKNPTGCTEVIKHLSKNSAAKFLIIINDNYADGRDVSWLWDADFEILGDLHRDYPLRDFLCSGHRAYDIALRLKYVGINSHNIKVVPNIKEALVSFVQSRSEEEELFVLPTYTALLEISSKP